MLAKLATRRQATPDTATLCVFAEDLSGYDLADIEEALNAVGRRKSEKYETAFPRIGDLVSEVKTVAGRRKAAAEYARQQAEEEAFMQRRKDHPEDFEDSPEAKDTVARLNALLADRSKPRSRVN